MATILLKPDGSYELTLTSNEQETYKSLPAGKLEAYITLWLEEQKRVVVQEQFNALPVQEQADVLALLKRQGQRPRPGNGRP